MPDETCRQIVGTTFRRCTKGYTLIEPLQVRAYATVLVHPPRSIPSLSAEPRGRRFVEKIGRLRARVWLHPRYAISEPIHFAGSRGRRRGRRDHLAGHIGDSGSAAVHQGCRAARNSRRPERAKARGSRGSRDPWERANGSDLRAHRCPLIQVRVTNKTKEPFPIRCKAGDVFDGGKSQCVILLKSFEADVPPGETKVQDLPVVATRSANPGDQGRFTSSSRRRRILRHCSSISNPTPPLRSA